MTPEPVARIAESAFDAELRTCRRLSDGSVAEAYRLALAGSPRRAVCKLGGASVWTSDVIEPAVVRLVRRRTDLPVPRVLATGSLEDGPERIPNGGPATSTGAGAIQVRSTSRWRSTHGAG